MAEGEKSTETLPPTNEIEVEDQLLSDWIELPARSRPIARGGFGDLFIGNIRGFKVALKRARFTLDELEGESTALEVSLSSHIPGHTPSFH